MRTTLTIDDDVLAAARSMADRQRATVGQVISELARSALRTGPSAKATRNGVPLLPRRKHFSPVTPELVRRLHDESL